MLGDSLFLTSGKRKMRATWLTLPLSLGLHVLAVAGLVVVPLLPAGGALGGARIRAVALLVPVPPTVPPGRGPAVIRHTEGDGGPRTIVRPGALTFDPVKIPDTIPEEDLLPSWDEGAGPGDVVDGGDPTGVPGGPAILGTDPVNPTAVPMRLGSLQRPHKLREVIPDYPEVARQARIQGVVVVEAVTDIYGRVATARVVAGHVLLNEAALRAVRQWVYEPYVVNGVPHPVVFTVTVTFTLAMAR